MSKEKMDKKGGFEYETRRLAFQLVPTKSL